jgi:hypothetical protein
VGDAKPDCNLSENTTSCQNGIVSQGTNANESGAAWIHACHLAEATKEAFYKFSKVA